MKKISNQTISQDERVAEAEKFLNLLFGHVTAPHFSYLITFNKYGAETFDFVIADETQRRAMARKAIELADNGKQVWHAVNPVCVKPHYEFDEEKQKKVFKRGGEDVVSYQTAIVVDVDIRSGAHKSGNLAVDFDEAKSFLPFTPSLILNSGYGLQAYYIFDEPIKITADNREEIKHRNKLFLDVIRARANGKDVDGVGDLPRIFRTPGTFNYKLGRDNAPLCHVVEVNDIRFTPADIDEKLAALKPTDENLFDAKKSARETGDNSVVVDTVGYDEYRAQIMIDCIEPVKLTYTDWLAVISSCKNLGISYSVVDAWNSRDPERYHEAENLTHWNSDLKPEFGIETLHGIAKRFDYSEKDTRRQWYDLHPKHDDTQAHPAQDVKKIPAELRLTDEQRKRLFSGDLSDLDNARRLEYLFGNKIRWLTDRNKWLTFRKGLWTVSNETNSAVAPLFNEFADILVANAADKNEFKFARRLKSSKVIAGAIPRLRGEYSIRITSDDLDNHPELLNCLNGVVDLQTGKLFNAAPELLLSQQVAADYQPNYRNEVVDKFFETVLPDEETRAALIRWLGYCISGDVSEEKALFIIGSGGNGKGTMTRFLITLLNTYAASIPVTAVCEAGRFKDAGAATPELNALEKCRFAVVEELPQGVRLDVAKFKLLTGGDKIPIRRLHEEFRNILPTHKLWLSGNHLPTLNDTRDPGLLRRLMNMKFEADFTKNPDRKLKQKLATPESLRALLSLLVDASQAWYRDGLLESAAMKQARADYLADNDFIGEFISQYCKLENNLSIPREDFLNRLKSKYSSECAKFNNDRALAKAVEKIEGISYKRSKNGFRFYGVGWHQETTDNEDLRGHDTTNFAEVVDEMFSD